VPGKHVASTDQRALPAKQRVEEHGSSSAGAIGFFLTGGK
jgi:hypothetical protein